MVNKLSIATRWGDYRASKALVFWSCVASVVATLIAGFGWGGWVRRGTAQEMATKAAAGAPAELAAAVCLHQFVNGANATTQLASLKGSDSWKRDTFIEEGGWVTLPGVEKPITGAASLCAQQLMDAKLPPKAAGTSMRLPGISVQQSSEAPVPSAEQMWSWSFQRTPDELQRYG